MSKATRKITEAMRAAMKQTTTGYDTAAEVKRIEGGIAWVHIPGGVDETPVKLTVDAKAGDIVQVRVSGGSAWIVGNATSPPTDDRVAKKAQETAEKAGEANKYITKITGRDGVTVHDAGDESNYANMNSSGMTVYKGGSPVAVFGNVVKLITRGTGLGRGKRIAKLDGDGLYLTDGNDVQLGGLGVVNKSSGYPDSCYIDFGHGAAIYVERATGHQPSGETPDEGAIDFYTNNQRGATLHTDGTLNCKKISAGNLQSGTVTFAQTASGSYSDKTISFSPSYSAAPNVVAGFQLGTGSTAANFGNCSVAVVSVSTTGATLRFYNNSGANKTPSVNWIALGA